MIDLEDAMLGSIAACAMGKFVDPKYLEGKSCSFRNAFMQTWLSIYGYGVA